MASDVEVGRIVVLLRLAESAKGTPEGDSAQARARALMDKHGIQVILGDIPPEEQPLSREKSENFGTFPVREHWMEQISHVVAWIYDQAPVWYWADNGHVGLMFFDPYGDLERLAAARKLFDDLFRIVQIRMPPYWIVSHPDAVTLATCYRAGVAHGLVTRLSSVGTLPRDSVDDDLDETTTALVPIRVHRRPRHQFVDPSVDVPIQGSEDDWADGLEARLFAAGYESGRAANLPHVGDRRHEDVTLGARQRREF